MKNNTTTTLIAAVGERGTDPKLTITDIESLAAQIGGTVNAYQLDKGIAVLYNRDAQTEMLIDPYNLQGGVIALCGVDSGKPVSLVSVKQLAKYNKVFKAPRTAAKTTTKGGEVGEDSL
jgi:hypothetical protein